MQLRMLSYTISLSLLFGITLTACTRPYTAFRAYDQGAMPIYDKRDPTRLLKATLQSQGVQVVEYGDSITLIVPTDRFYVFDTAELNDIQHAALNNIAALASYYPVSVFNIAGFTDEVGTWRYRQKLSLHRAQMMRTFLWANGVDLHRLIVVGYGDHYDVANNITVFGSAYNRRVEIQWKTYPQPPFNTPFNTIHYGARTVYVK